MIYLAIFLFGLIFGSFINVLIYRIPKEQSIVLPRSSCPSCQTPIKPWHNIPILSYLLLRGKCDHCGTDISKQYPIIELLTGIIFVAVAYKSGITTDALIIAVMFSLLLALSTIDIYYKMVPDSLNLSALTLAIFAVHPLEGFEHALLFAGGFALLRFYLSYIIKKEAMGEGDIMIAATIGALVGIHLGLVTIFLSAILAMPFALITKDEKKQVPYIPFLVAALFISYFFNTYIYQLLDRLYA
jgi:leader peptidase (prepilin peptidase)/N-methyltransferase